VAALIASATAFVFSINVFPELAITAFGFTGLLIALAVFKFKFFRLSPSGAVAEVPPPKAGAERSPVIYVLIFILLASAFLTFGYLSYLHYKKRFLTEASARLEAISALKAAELHDWRRERVADAEILRLNPSLHRLARRIIGNPSDVRAREELRAWLEGYETYGQYDRIFLLDAGGAELMSFLAPGESVPAFLVQMKADVLKAGRTEFLDFHRDAEEGNIHLSLLIPIQAEHPAATSPGLLVLRIDPFKYLYPFITEWPVPSASAETLLVRSEGDEVVFLNALRFRPDAALKLRFSLKNNRLPAAMAALGLEGIVQGADYRGVPVLAALRAVPDSPWRIVTRIDLEEVQAPLRERLWLMMLVLGALTAAAGGGLATAWRHQRLGDFRRLAESAAALRRSEGLLHKISANFPHSYLFIIERNMTVGFASGQELQKRGLDPGSFIGLTLEQVFGERAEYVRGHYLRTFAGEETEFEMFFDGQHRLYRAVPILDARGGVERILVVAENITERRRYEERMAVQRRIADAFLSAEDNEAFDAVLQIILEALKSPLGALGYINERGDFVVPSLTRSAWDECRVPGKSCVFPRDSLKGSGMPAALRKQKAVVSNDAATNIPEGHLPIRRNIAVPLIYQDRTIGIIQAANKESDYGEEDVLFLEEICRFIAPILSARLQRAGAMESLRALSGRQQAFLAAIPDIIMEVDSRKIYTWANDAGIDFFGEDVIGREAAHYFLGEQKTYDDVRPLFKGDESVLYVESWQRRRDGEARLLAWWCRGLKDKRGNVVGALSTARDITDRKRQEAEILAAQAELKRLLGEAEKARRVLLSVVEDQKAAEEEIRRLNAELERRVRERTAQLEAANKELEAFAYSASHDLRAPLRGIDGWSLALLEDYHHALDEEGHRFLARIRSETQRMGRLIDDLLRFSRETRGEINWRNVNLTALAAKVAFRLRGDAPEKALRFDIQPGLRARGDARLLEIALVNLLDNAVKFSRRRTPATVEFGRADRDGRKVFFVRDNGVGFDMACASKLFTMFQRLHSAAEFPGTGVGLATVQRIINRHGGRIWAESELGRGATFYFTLEDLS